MQAMQTNVDRAATAYAAMQRYLYASDGTSLYREEYPWQGGNPYAYLWPFSRALIGTLSMAGMAAAEYKPAVNDRLSGLAKYRGAWGNPAAFDSYVVQPLGQGGDRYYDDNAWLALALVEQHRLGLSDSLHRAQQLFDFARSGWDRHAKNPAPGGVFWVEQGRGMGRSNHDRGAGLNAGYARLGFLLHELTGSSTYDGDGDVGASPRVLGAENMLNWVVTNLDSNRNGTGPYWNVMRQDGSIDTNLWSYVQGEMIATRAVQYRLTNDVRFLQVAEDIARETLTHFGAFTRQPPSFNAMCFQALLLLSSLTRDSLLRSGLFEKVGAYADWAWDEGTGARDARTNLFHFNSAGLPAREVGGPATLQDQGAMVHIYALLGWDAENYSKLT